MKIQPSKLPSIHPPTKKPDVAQPAKKPDVAQPAKKPDVAQPAKKPDVAQPAKKPDVAQPAKKPGFHFHDIRTLRYIHVALGLILVVAGGLKLYSFATADQEDNLATLFVAALAEVEFFAGLWLMSGIHVEPARPWVIAIFAGFWTATSYQILTGNCSCGCFGSAVVNPWYVWILDTMVLVVLLKWHPPEGQFRYYSSPSSLAGMAFLALVIGVVGIRQENLIPIAGRAQWRGEALAETPLVFQGNLVRVEIQTDRDGFFNLPPVEPGLYSVSMTRSSGLSGSKAETPVQSAATKTAAHGAQSQSSASRAKKSTAARTKQAVSELAKEYADREIVAVELDSCSVNPMTIEFK